MIKNQYYSSQEIKVMDNKEISKVFYFINKYMPTIQEIEHFKLTGVAKKIPRILEREEYKL
jgi:hypothetical protein